MSNTQAERAVNQLYESDTLRSELRDEEASLLLHWGEARIMELAERDLPDSEFDRLTEGLRSLLAAINVCVGKRKTSPSQHLSMMATIGSTAEAAGFTLPEEDQAAFLKHQAGLANQDAISELLGLLKPAEAAPQPPPPPSETIGEAVAEIAAPEPVINDLVEEVKTSPSEPAASEEQQASQISGDQTDKPSASAPDSAAAPQPEELPEFPPQSSQED